MVEPYSSLDLAKDYIDFSDSLRVATHQLRHDKHQDRDKRRSLASFVIRQHHDSDRCAAYAISNKASGILSLRMCNNIMTK
jgi:hypothetical protein